MGNRKMRVRGNYPKPAGIIMNWVNPTAPGQVLDDIPNPTVLADPTVLSPKLGECILSLSSDPDNKFALVNGQFRTNGTFDAGVDTSHPYTIRATDRRGWPDGGVEFSDSITVIAAGGGGLVPSLQRHGITWTFKTGFEPASTGQFRNGDHWCTPCTVETVSPGWDGLKNGSMVNPVPGGLQGFDLRADVDPADNHAYNNPFGNRSTFPLVLTAGQSLVSSIGGSAIMGVGGGNKTWIHTHAVLTCLASAPASPSTKFRPPFVAGSKPLYDESDVNYNLLLDLGALPAAFRPVYVPSLAAVFPELNPPTLNRLTAPWVDLGPITWGHYLRPYANMPGYGLDMAQVVSLMLGCMSVDNPDKISLANTLIQIGIDFHATSLTNDAVWSGAGGHGFGRKAPVVFAKFMLGAAASGMVIPQFAVGASGIRKFSEDNYFYYGVPTGPWPGGKPLYGDPSSSLNASNNIARDVNGLMHGGAGESSWGDWGGWFTELYPDGLRPPNPANEWHGVDGLQTFPAGSPKGGGYRSTTSPFLVLQAIILDMMGAKPTWNYDAFFDYMRYVWMEEPLYWKPARQPPNWHAVDSNSTQIAIDSSYGGLGVPTGATGFAKWFVDTHSTW